MKTDYDEAVARIAGSIAAGCEPEKWWHPNGASRELARVCVEQARAIVDEVRRTEPVADTAATGKIANSTLQHAIDIVLIAAASRAQQSVDKGFNADHLLTAIRLVREWLR